MSGKINLKEAPIGVFDSGVGGISVLKALKELMPQENYRYIGDSKHAPYGTKSIEEVRELTLFYGNALISNGAKALVIACNTATSAAIHLLRKKHQNIPVIGIEPALKPAVLAKPNSRIVVMATPMTLSENKFAHLMKEYEQESEIIKLPCPGLVEFIEEGEIYSEALLLYLEQLFANALEKPIDGVVLGCTHYPFIKEALYQVLGKQVVLYEGGPGTARETKRRLRENGLLSTNQKSGEVLIENTSQSLKKIDLCYELIKG